MNFFPGQQPERNQGYQSEQIVYNYTTQHIYLDCEGTNLKLIPISLRYFMMSQSSNDFSCCVKHKSRYQVKQVVKQVPTYLQKNWTLKNKKIIVYLGPRIRRFRTSGILISHVNRRPSEKTRQKRTQETFFLPFPSKFRSQRSSTSTHTRSPTSKKENG